MRGSTPRCDSPSEADHTNPTFGAILRRLPGAQKSARGAPAYSRFVNRRAGGCLAAVAHLAGRTPNEVTLVSALCTLTGILALALLPPSPVLGVGVAAALLLGYALDSADGQLARLRGDGGPSGEWLDHVVDSAKIPMLHSAVLVSTYRFGDHPDWWLLVPLGFTVVESVLFFAMILNEQLRKQHAGTEPASDSTPSAWRSLLVSPTDYGVLCLVFVLLGAHLAFTAAYTALFLAQTLFACAALPGWFLRAKRLTANGGEP
ncbi:MULTISPECIES: CDP-alcohol phosphatidyltransferase family protein [unclassified Actinopolyspora]|uniref:CDP-alcohol phosphatidyltransferase family protein n=1 Tax=unclassified Actinopolyspora TaxID=2639451 RepID=UPI0013F62E26|nr:CDP-alcohol phosphatidyltransferase family protein [Actinopolyspora sp. BKK2]NHE76363.1 CDP-alcohol phosphatidyltransferase family protein [Actinopolyspora sp. BKK1]